MPAALSHPHVGKTLVVQNGSAVEVGELGMIGVVNAVAGHVECRVAGTVLGELVGPEVLVWGALVDPVSEEYRH